MGTKNEWQIENMKKALNMSQEDINDCNNHYEMFYGESS